MLDRCLEYLCQRVNQSLDTVYDISEELALVAPPTDTSKQSLVKNDNKILLFISGIDRDPFSKQARASSIPSQGLSPIKKPPLYLSISLVVAANFSPSNYTDGLKTLSHVMAFFHRNPVFNLKNSPDLPAGLEQIALEIETLSEGRLGHMWGMLGSHYLPSCVYQVRIEIPNSNAVIEQTGQLANIQPRLTTKDD
ncbi:DUF4255 domain-containing protein [Vibrio sp. WXL103]|uniref:DUF4255 domain-containing protein n=1 Tax=Vibrio sp. WXL103 TaxID=3450710 RepID=UPI003EC79254